MLSVKLLASLLLLSVAAEASSKFCKKNVPLLEGCLKRGYQAKIFKNCTTSEGKMEKKERKSCAKIEKKISKKCESFECGTTNGFIYYIILKVIVPLYALLNIKTY